MSQNHYQIKKTNVEGFKSFIKTRPEEASSLSFYKHILTKQPELIAKIKNDKIKRLIKCLNVILEDEDEQDSSEALFDEEGINIFIELNRHANY